MTLQPVFPLINSMIFKGFVCLNLNKIFLACQQNTFYFIRYITGFGIMEYFLGDNTFFFSFPFGKFLFPLMVPWCHTKFALISTVSVDVGSASPNCNLSLSLQTSPHATVEIEISEDMQLAHLDFNRYNCTSNLPYYEQNLMLFLVINLIPLCFI